MPLDTSKSLYDMQHAIERIERFALGKSFQDYVGDELLRSAIERQFAIIGEAMTRLLKVNRPTGERITDYRKIAGFRNALVHGYDSIDDKVSWGVVTLKLPVLKEEVAKLIVEFGIQSG